MTAPGGGSLGSALIQIRADLTQLGRNLRQGLQNRFNAAVNALSGSSLFGAAANMGNQAGNIYGTNFTRGADGRIRDARGRFVSQAALNAALAGRAAGRAFDNSFDISVPPGLMAMVPMLAAMAGKGLLAGAALVKLVPIIAALGQASLGVVATLPALIVAFQFASKTITTALKGVSDAFGAALEGDAAKFEESLKGLAPAAQTVAREFAGMAPLLKGLQQAVQQEFFRPLQGSFLELRKSNVVGVLRDQMTQLAFTFGEAGAGILSVVSASAKTGQLANILGGLQRGFEALAEVVPRVVKVFLDMAEGGANHAATILSILAGAIEDLTSRAEDWVASGGFEQFIGNGFDTLSEVWKVLVQIGSIVGSIFGALGAEGANAFGVLGSVLATVAGFLDSIEGKTALQEIARVLGMIGTAVSQGLSIVLPIVAQLIGALAGPLADALVKLMPAIMRVVGAMAQVLGPVIEALAPVIDQIVAGLADFLVEALLAVSDHIVKMLPYLQQFLDALGPHLGPVIDAFIEALLALVPILPEISNAIVTLIPVLIELIPLFVFMAQVSATLWQGIAVLIGWIVQLVGWFANIVASAVVGWFTLFKDTLSDLPELFQRVGQFFADLWDTISEKTVAGVEAAVSWFAGLPGRAMAAISSLKQTVANFFTDLWNGAVSKVTEGINKVVGGVAALPGKISAFAGRMFEAGANLGRSIGNGLQNIGNFASDIGGKIVGAVKRGVNAVIGGINRGISSIDDFIPGSLPRIPYLARGAIVNEPTLAMIGEAGSEVVIPLTNRQRAAELAQESGLLKMIGGVGNGMPVVNVTAILDGFGVLDVIDTRITQAFGGASRELSMGVR